MSNSRPAAPLASLPCPQPARPTSLRGPIGRGFGLGAIPNLNLLTPPVNQVSQFSVFSKPDGSGAHGRCFHDRSLPKIVPTSKQPPPVLKTLLRRRTFPEHGGDGGSFARVGRSEGIYSDGCNALCPSQAQIQANPDCVAGLSTLPRARQPRCTPRLTVSAALGSRGSSHGG